MLTRGRGKPLSPIPKAETLEAVISRRLDAVIDAEKQLHNISHLRLDRENIKVFDLDLQEYSNITHLYLQHNRLTELTLSSENLCFLSLSNNAISTLKLNTPELVVLDVENNLINCIDDIPQNVEFLNLKGNPVTQTAGYRSDILKKFKNLKELDGIQLPSYDFSLKQEMDKDQEEMRTVDYEGTVQQILKRSRERQSVFLKEK
jgi:Leucine-rich repeat (LRR) protein